MLQTSRPAAALAVMYAVRGLSHLFTGRLVYEFRQCPTLVALPYVEHDLEPTYGYFRLMRVAVV